MTLAHRVLASPFWPMLRKEFIQMRRDRLTLGLMIGVPAIQLMLFGFAIQTEVRNLPTVVLDESRSSESRALVAAIENTGNFRLRGTVDSREEMHRRIVNGEAAAAVIIPPDYTDDIKHGRTATAQVIVDAADPLASAAAIGGAQPGRECALRGPARRQPQGRASRAHQRAAVVQPDAAQLRLHRAGHHRRAAVDDDGGHHQRGGGAGA